MAFTERQEYKIEVIPPFSILQCRRADIIERDGVEVGRTYQRHVRCPGDQSDENWSDECSEMQAIATALWTDEVIAAYAAYLEAQTPPGS